MGKHVFLTMLIGVLLLLVTACGNDKGESGTISNGGTSDDVASAYQQSAFLGDSMLVGLTEVLNDSQIISNAGATAMFALKEVESLAIIEPERVFTLLGSSDLLMPVDDPIEDSVSHYATLLEQINEKLPNAEIYVLSVPEVTSETLAIEPRYQDIPDYNEALESMTEAKGVGFIDLSPLFEGKEELHDGDGVHFKDEFYPLFLNHIANEIQGGRDEG
ncbi:GDSL-type esterase/lipase family protein [Alkalihalobacillus oceani]|uniref:GDSL-type esterase/lipase family protein n=1 Tax=Halalkalibacter oceani TaxID=1653776 RepID=A0A9X2DN14_9BACI|nr:GDSL-type esterase/lipase family protein [Halalkalibacter oceani]MCM3713861.1 GDSL-type esterase/lipase family protein [Halalkalibacter oceani]